MTQDLRRRVSLGALVFAAACGADSPEGPAGRYELVRANGQPLPYTNALVAVTDSTCQPTITRAALTLTAEQAYEADYELRRACMDEGVVHTETYDETIAGRYVLEGGIIHFREAGGAETGAAVMQGTAIGDTLSLYNQPLGLTLTFVRREPETSE